MSAACQTGRCNLTELPACLTVKVSSLKWTMPLSDFRFYAGAPSGEERMLGAVELHSGRFDFGWIDDGCWKRLRKYGAGAMEFG